MAAYIDAHAGEVDDNERRLVVRNGYHREREVLTASGAVHGDRAARQRQARRCRYRRAAKVFLRDPASVGAQVTADERGSAAAVSAWPVDE